MTQREEFEAWFTKASYCFPLTWNGFLRGYENGLVQMLWIGWQAAKAQDNDLLRELLAALRMADSRCTPEAQIVVTAAITKANKRLEQS